MSGHSDKPRELKMPIAKINDHDMYYEVHGTGDPLICMGGWDTFCHGRAHFLARGLTDRYSAVIFDYRGIGESTDDLGVQPSMELHADDVIGLLDELGYNNVHFVGLVGMGACVAQQVAIKRPDLVRSMLNMGAWASVDPFLADQLKLFRNMHEHAGFFAFQECVAGSLLSAGLLQCQREKLLGEGGVWVVFA